MSDSAPAVPAECADALAVHRLAELFEADWRPENWDRIAELVGQAPPHLARAVVQELIAIDVQRRVAEQLTLPSVHSYLNRFPDLAADPDWQQRFGAAGGKAEASAEQATPAQIGRYPVNGLLARSGEADVYLCFHPEWRRQVVVKWMRAEGAARSGWRDRFARQGELLKGLEHEHIVRVYDQGECAGRPFVVTEYIQGRTLDRYFRDARPDAARSAEIVAAVAEALSHAHGLGAVHQDVKPANILIDEHGRVKLIDFGVAWFRPAWAGEASVPGGAAGTPGYLSPEQARSGEVTARADVFGLGAVLYFLLTGSALYPEPDLDAALRRARACDWDRSALARPSVSTRLRAVCERALAADPNERHASAEEFAAAVRAATRVPWYRTKRGIVTAAVLVSLFAGAIIAGRILFARSPQPVEPVPAEKVNLVVMVRRPESDPKRPVSDPKPLPEVVPLRTGDSLQARFRVPARVHASLVSVNGSGNLIVLQSYEPRPTAYEAIWPGPGNGMKLTPPPGTEFLFVCGRTERASTVAELREAWGGDAAWPALEPTGRFMRVRPDEVTVEEFGKRDFGEVVEFPESDRVKGRLEQFRERLRDFPVFDGIAFRHQ